MSNRCQCCKRMLLSASTICEICQAETRQKLAEIPKLYVEAEAYLTPGRGGSGSSGSERTIGVNLAALGFRQGADILDRLEDWERLVRVKELGQVELDGQDRPGEMELNDDGTVRMIARPGISIERPLVRQGSVRERLERVCEFLLAHSRWLSGYEASGEWVSDVAYIHARGEAATRKVIEKPTRIKCPATVEVWVDDEGKHVPCNQFLILTEDAEAKIECRRCGTVWTVARLLAVAVSTPGAHVMLDPKAIAGFLGMQVANVHIFAKRHGIEMVGKKYSLVAFVMKRGDERHADEGA